MRKIIIMGLMAMLMMSFAIAQPVNVQELTHAQIRERIEMQAMNQNITVDGLQVQARIGEQVATQTIQRNMERINNTNALEALENVVATLGENESVIIQGEADAKMFGFINVNRELTFVASEEGELNRVRRGFDFLFRYEEEIRQVEEV